MPTRDCTFMVAISPPNSQESLKYNVQQHQQNDATQIAIKPFCKNPLYYLILLGNGNGNPILYFYICTYMRHNKLVYFNNMLLLDSELDPFQLISGTRSDI